MSEQEEITDQPPADDAPEQRVRKRRGFGPVLLALLALAIVAAAGYVYWRVEGIGGTGGIESRLSDDIARLEQEMARTRSMARSSTDEMQANLVELTQALAAQGESLDEIRAELSAEDRRDSSPDPRAWRIAEVEYLLRIANNRLLLERDPRAADQMLASADAILEELDDYALHDVRAMIAEERMALVNTNAANVQSIFLTLEAIKEALPELPLKQPEYFDASGGEAMEASPDETEEVSDPEPESFTGALEKRFFGLFEFRTRESVAPRPLIRPEEAIYLELNLRLALERAQLSMLRGDQTLFAASVNAAREWLDQYVDPDHAVTRHIAQDLDRLAGLDIEQPMPDISGSLARLREIRNRQPEPEPSAGRDSPTADAQGSRRALPVDGSVLRWKPAPPVEQGQTE